MTHPHDPYGEPSEWEDAVGRLEDPLNDPLPGGGGTDRQAERHGSPWFRPHQSPSDGQYAGRYEPADPAAFAGTYGYDALEGRPAAPAEPRGAERRGDHPGLEQPGTPYTGAHHDPLTGPYHDPYAEPLQQQPQEPYGDPFTDPYQPAHGDGSVGEAHTSGRRGEHTDRFAEALFEGYPDDNETMALRQAEKPAEEREAPTPPPEARKPAPRRGGRRRKGGAGTAGEPGGGEGTGGKPTESDQPSISRVERRKAAAKERRTNASAFASRAIGEVFITTGVLLLLFVTYQLWWTNVQANQQAKNEANSLERAFDEGEGEEPEAFEPGEGFAIMYIPKLDVRVPIAEGIEKGGVLDRGMAGHYDKKSGLETAMPWDEKGNFAVAGHRNTHGEPFRYINKLKQGDQIIVETRNTYYTYEVSSWLPSTSPRNIDVVSPVPKQSGFKKPGRYVTLTTCTPEFSSKYRLIVWGTMVEERPRSEGKPDALG